MHVLCPVCGWMKQDYGRILALKLESRKSILVLNGASVLRRSEKGTWTRKPWKTKKESVTMYRVSRLDPYYTHSSIPILPLSLLRQQALLCPGPGQATSHIFYEPDTYDDLDQEDPDDDLDI